MNSTRLQRLGGIAGLVFSGLVVATIVLSANGPSPGDAASKVNAYFASGTNREKLNAAGLLYGVASACFLVWLAALAERLRALETGRAWLSSLVLGTGVVVIGLELVSAACVMAYPFSLGFFDAARADVQLALVTTAISYAAAGLAGILTGALAAVAGVAALSTGALPRWAAWTSIVLAPLALIAALLNFAPAMLLLWVLALSVVLVGRGERHPAAVPVAS